MSLTREQIVEQLVGILGEDNVVTDEAVLRQSSVDRFRRFEELHGVFTQPLPAAVVYVHSTAEVAEVLKFAHKNLINVVPRTGQTATEGGLETAVANSIVVDGSRMNKIIKLDTYNMQATCQCGTPLQVLEDQLRALGYTTGHSPQSKPLAQLGGLVATRSIGQFSTLYGGIEEMVVGLEAVFPNGHIARIKNVPRRAAGPDIRHVVIGNEGALCFITEVTVKIYKFMPENNILLGYTLDRMKTGFEILRQVMVNGYRPSVARLYDPEDADYHFSHFSEGRCVLIFMAEGPKAIAEATAAAIKEIVARHPECQEVDSRYIQVWFDNLNWDASDVAEERAEILETKNIGNTTEISADWEKINVIYEACVERIRREVPDMTLVGGHSSHSYINGTNLYFVHYYNVVDCKPEEELTKYHLPIKTIIVEETLKAGGAICHHHGVGKYRTPWIDQEHGSAYYILETLKRAFDPRGIMNKGTIFKG
ncbi:MAG TPA: FAD-binding oxidoreductase [Firmicutes bacterium]|jgi:alkyldihydroxyacetonephosphate synthase|nr:FAD-binding oxidoreductase [Bacillota bacterium]